MRTRLAGHGGQSLIEFTLVMPLLLLLMLGVIEFGYVLLDEHVVTKLSREGSNMISRDTPLVQARVALASMSTRPVDFTTGSKLIFTVIRKGATAGTANFDQHIVYQRYDYGDGSLPDSAIHMQGSGSFPAPEYVAVGSDTNTGLRVVPETLPPGFDLTRGGMIYVTEIYTRHQLLTPLDRLGITVPQTLYSIAYF
jgi:hypothetical protein